MCIWSNKLCFEKTVATCCVRACAVLSLTRGIGGIHDVIIGSGLAEVRCLVAYPYVDVISMFVRVGFTTILPLQWPCALLSLCFAWGPHCLSFVVAYSLGPFVNCMARTHQARIHTWPCVWLQIDVPAKHVHHKLSWEEMHHTAHKAPVNAQNPPTS